MVMPWRKLPSASRTKPSPDTGDPKRITVVPPGGAGAVRGEMPTLIDDAELEAARLASMRRSSVPPAPRTAAKAPPPEGEIHVVWDPESEPFDAEELFAKYVALLGAFTRMPVVLVPFDQLPSLSMDSRMGFLVALIDGSSSIQTILDVSGMPPREVLHALATLRDLGIMGFRAE